MRKTFIAAGAAFALAIPLTVLAQAKPETLVKQRQAAMTLQGKYIGPIGAMVNGKIPYNADVVARNATYLENLSQMPWDGFHESTKGEKSAARPEIWTEPAKFQEAADRLQAETVKLATAARAKDEAGVKAQFPAVGKACGACHESFRVKQ
ncbi:MAG TPA: cytochrome c [Burkholderiales bacterium]|nr:cytochrome c [Burkholderiales bacterium]